MILDEFVNVKWHYTNKKYFSEKGYVFTKSGDIFCAKVSDLNKGSSTSINIKCDVCGKNLSMLYWIYIRNCSVGGYIACSKLCSLTKNKKTNLERYGIENPSQREEVKNKKRNSNIKNFGVPCVLQNNIIKEKIKKTNLRKYGVEYVSQNEKIKIKKELTNIKKFGVKYPIQNAEVMAKMKKTNLERYGFDCVFKNKEIKKKIQNTMIERYGEIWLKHVPTYNPNSIIYLDMLSKKLGLPIQHALNGGEKKFIRYWVDGYIEQYNICIEWDERWHNKKENKEKDLKREQFLIENFGCHITRINEKEFLKDITNQLNLIYEKINNIINFKIAVAV